MDIGNNNVTPMSNEDEPRRNVNWMFIGNNARELTAIIYERRIFAELKLIISQSSNFDASELRKSDLSTKLKLYFIIRV